MQSLDIFCLNAEIPVPGRPIRKPRIFVVVVCTHLIFIFLSLIFSVFVLFLILLRMTAQLSRVAILVSNCPGSPAHESALGFQKLSA